MTAQNLNSILFATEQEAASQIFDKVKAGLEGVEKQEANAEKYSALDKGAATYGVVKKLRDNDMDIHENNPVRVCNDCCLCSLYTVCTVRVTLVVQFMYVTCSTLVRCN